MPRSASGGSAFSASAPARLRGKRRGAKEAAACTPTRTQVSPSLLRKMDSLFHSVLSDSWVLKGLQGGIVPFERHFPAERELLQPSLIILINTRMIIM